MQLKSVEDFVDTFSWRKKMRVFPALEKAISPASIQRTRSFFRSLYNTSMHDQIDGLVTFDEMDKSERTRSIHYEETELVIIPKIFVFQKFIFMRALFVVETNERF